MFLIAIVFLAGHCVLHSLSSLPDLRACLVVAAVACLAALGFARLTRRSANVWAPFAFAVGFGLAAWTAHVRLDDRWQESGGGADVDVEGYIASIVAIRNDNRNSEGRTDKDRRGKSQSATSQLDASESGESQRFLFDVERADVRVPSHIEVTWYDSTLTPRPGEKWALRLRLRSLHGFANPGGFDYEAQMLRENIGATAYVRAGLSNRRTAAATGYWVLRARSAIAERLAGALPNSAMLGIVQGLAVGETSRMTPEQWRVFANTGTTHLMAISGMHIGMVALAIAWLTRRCLQRLPLQRYRISAIDIYAFAGIVAAIAYALLAGLSVPTKRTLIMLCAYFCTRLLRRHVAPTQGFAWALIGVLLADPFAPLQPGFWLSFGAVGAIFLGASGSIVAGSRLLEYGRMQWIATVGLLPLLVVLFGSLSVIAPLVNLVAIPFFTLLVVPLVLIASALLFVHGGTAAAVLCCVVKLLEWSWSILQPMSQWPLALWSLPEAPVWAFAMLLFGTLLLLAPGAWATRIAGALLCLPSLFWQPSRPQSGEFALAVLDVGQGLSVVVATQSRVLVYDLGPKFRGGRDTGEMVVVPYLHARGIDRIDTLMISHGDSDHVGGLDSVLERIPVERLLLGPSVRKRNQSETCAAGQTWIWDAVRFTVLYPPNDSTDARRNDSSCVLRIEGSGGSALLLGDMEKLSEEWLIRRHALAKTDVVVVPHHGSRTSSSAALVNATLPSIALTSAGFANQWGFPRPEVVERWESMGAQPWLTAKHGALEVAVTRAGSERPRSYRLSHRRYWRD